jgi:Rrf2 family protein
MEFSCRIGYVILALVELAAQYEKGEPLQLKEIAARQHLPCRYLEHLLALLRRSALVRSQRGVNGGYTLARPPHEITLLDIVNGIEGLDGQVPEEVSNLKTPESRVVLDVWQEAHDAANEVLKHYTLAELLQKRDAQANGKLMYYI